MSAEEESAAIAARECRFIGETVQAAMDAMMGALENAAGERALRARGRADLYAVSSLFIAQIVMERSLTAFNKICTARIGKLLTEGHAATLMTTAEEMSVDVVKDFLSRVVPDELTPAKKEEN